MRTLAYHEEVEAVIDRFDLFGASSGLVDGVRVSIPGALEGERVRARIFHQGRRGAQADLLEILEPSPRRIVPRCSLFGRCGGCQLQHLAYAEQLRLKEQWVRGLFARIGQEARVRPVHASPREFGYRSKITPHFFADRGEGIESIGFLHVGTRSRIVDVEQCPIATEAINQRLPEERARIRVRAETFTQAATLLLRETADGVVTDPAAPARVVVRGVEFVFPAGEFFQNNPFILEAFVDYVVGQAVAGGQRHLVDAYCGSGLFGLVAAARFERVTGVEISPAAVERARANAERNGLHHVEILHGRAEDVFAPLEGKGGELAVLVDPPRKGCGPDFMEQAAELAPARLVYVSCNPETQVKDLGILLERGYRLESVQPFDLFPQTRHVETVATLVRKT